VRPTPRPFQVAGVEWLRSRRRGCLFDEMGLGKTMQLLLALPERAPVIVACPAVVKASWATECRTWRPDLAVQVLEGRHCLNRWPRAGEVLVLNYEVLPSVDQVRLLGHAPAGLILVADEAHRLKSRKTKAWESWKALRLQVRRAGGRLFGLTGTPLLSSPAELWQVLNAFDCAEECFDSWMRFVRLFHGRPGWHGGTEWGAPRPEVPELLRRASLRRRKEDVLEELPPKTYRVVPVSVDATTRKACDEASAELRALGVDVPVASLEALRKAAQGASFETMSRARLALAAAKLAAALELAAEYEEEGVPLVVFSAHVAPVEAFGRRDGWAAIHGGVASGLREAAVRDFQVGRLRGLALTIGAGGVGITLTRASHVLRIDRDWTPALNTQAVDRLHRIGQRSAVLVVDLVADHALDRRLAEVLGEKEGFASAVDASAVAPYRGELFS
jgi:SNF2 family DNA or RNA helicase